MYAPHFYGLEIFVGLISLILRFRNPLVKSCRMNEKKAKTYKVLAAIPKTSTGRSRTTSSSNCLFVNVIAFHRAIREKVLAI